MSFIQIDGLKKYYGNQQVLKGVNLQINQGDKIVIQGSSGSGKSTLLYLLGGLESQYEGQICVGGKFLIDLSDERLAEYRNRELGFIFQFHFLLPALTARQNILLPTQISGRPQKEQEEWVDSMANRLGIFPVLQKHPFELSGGEQQRVNVLRSLIMRPKLLLCDEPTGNLDSYHSEQVIKLILELGETAGTTIILVTHDGHVASHFPKSLTMLDGQLH